MRTLRLPFPASPPDVIEMTVFISKEPDSQSWRQHFAPLDPDKTTINVHSLPNILAQACGQLEPTQIRARIV